MNREDLWEEAIGFCEYISADAISIQSIWVFGSYLWKDDPGDMDVYIDCKDDLAVRLFNSAFPNIHPTNSQDQTKNRVLIWTREDGMYERYGFPSREELMMREILMLREQMAELRMAARGPPRRYGKDG